MELVSVVWSEGPRVLSPNELHDALLRERAILSHLPCDVYALYDRATVVCMIASALRRYAADHREMIDPSVRVQVRSALQVAEREMHWFGLCGGDAHETELRDAISTAVTSAAQAASLLRTDGAGAVIAETEHERSLPFDGRDLEIAG